MIELQGVSKSYNYKKTNETVALNNVDLRIENGEMVAIVGPSGAGKSTLLHVIGGLCKFQSGKYLFNGTDVSEFTESQRSKHRNENIGIVMQNFALIDEYSVLDNVTVPLFFRRGVKNRKKLALAALEKTGISHLKNKYVSELSGGEKQRCAISRCLCQNPQVILADEPTGQLDSANAEKIMQMFIELNQGGMTIVIVTHDEKVASKCSRVITLRDGKIESDRR